MLFVKIANAEITKETLQPLYQEPSKVYGTYYRDDYERKIFALEKRIAELEKIIKEHIDKPHVYFTEGIDLFKCKPNEGILTDVPCDDKIKKSH